MKIPLDLNALDDNKISLASLNTLPFDIIKLSEIEMSTQKLLNALICKMDLKAEILLASYKIFVPISNYIYWKVFENEVLKRNIILNYNIENNNFLNMLQNGAYKNNNNARKITNYYKFKILIKNLLLSFKGLAFNNKRPILVHNSISLATARSIFPKRNLVFFSYNTWFEQLDKIAIKNNLVEDIVKEIYENVVLKLIRKYNIIPSESEINVFKKLIFDRVTIGLKASLLIKSKRLAIFDALLTDTPRSEISKSIAIYFKTNGKQVHETLHGHQHVLDWNYYSWAEFPFLTHLHTKFETSSDMYWLMTKYKSIAYSNPTIVNEEPDKIIFSFREDYKGERLLLIGSPYTNFGLLSQVSSVQEIQQYIHEKCIFNYFTLKGKKVTYKPHPEGKYLGEVEKFWEGPIEKNRFEDIFNNYDGFIFYHTRTSVFPRILETEKPIYLVDIGVEKYAPYTEHILKNRCKLITFDEIAKYQ